MAKEEEGKKQLNLPAKEGSTFGWSFKSSYGSEHGVSQMDTCLRRGTSGVVKNQGHVAVGLALASQLTGIFRWLLCTWESHQIL